LGRGYRCRRCSVTTSTRSSSRAITTSVQQVDDAVYPPTATSFPIGQAVNKKLSINAGNCNHRAYVPKLVEMVRMGRIDPLQVLTKVEPLTQVIDAYGHLDKRESGWIKTELKLAKAAE